jgi:hypothetical protein
MLHHGVPLAPPMSKPSPLALDNDGEYEDMQDDAKEEINEK